LSENLEPIVFQMPPDYYSPELEKIWNLIEGVDGYSAYGEKLGDLANKTMREWYENAKVPEDYDLALACLFYESRRSRFVSGYPAESDLPYLQDLAKVIEKCGDKA
jgi:hypothetical protein